jgi:DnaJ-class molecular chaperone
MFKGDLYVVCKVIIPTRLSSSQKRLLEELNASNLASDNEFRRFNDYVK